MPNVYINGTDLSPWLVVYEVFGHRDIPRADRPERTVPGRIGSVVMGEAPTWQPRDITVTGHVIATTLSSMYDALDQIAILTSGMEHEIQIVDDTSRVFTGRLQGMTGIPLRPSLTTPKTRVSYRFRCYDPRAFSTGNSTLAFGSTDTTVPLGSAPSGGVLRVTGAASAPSFIYKTSTGDEIARITLNTTLGGGEFVDIDLDNFTITGTTGDSQTTVWASTVSRFFYFQPPRAPTIQVTAGSGSLTYKKAYW
jgi:phage-related protein